MLTTCRLLGMVNVEQNGEDGGRITNPRLVVTPTWFSPVKKTSGGLSEECKAEIEQFFATAGYFADADPKILGWVSAREAMAHIEAKLIKK